MSDDLIRMDAVDLIDGYRQGRFSPVDATAAVLARIHAVNDKINAFMIIDDEGAMAAARESEARWSKGAPKGLIDGVPTTIKDLMLTKGWPTLKGSLTVDPAGPWDEDAPCVARLREHGAVLLGKTTTPEVGWKGITDSALSGITRNPWNLAKTPGGSSGGASAALAANMGPLAVGSDGGGSIRIPSNYCGVFGIKPSYGRVPHAPNDRPFSTISSGGPIARTVTDAALFLNVVTQPDDRDWRALPPDGRDYRIGLDDGVRGLRIAYAPALGGAEAAAEILAATSEAVRVYQDLGAVVEEVGEVIVPLKPRFETYWIAGFATRLRGMAEEKRALLEPDFRTLAEAGLDVDIEEYLRGEAERIVLGLEFAALHRDYDLLLTPTQPTLPPTVETRYHSPEFDRWRHAGPFTGPFNLTGQPAASIPCGVSDSGLPIGLQIVGPRFADHLVLRAARAYEAARATPLAGPALRASVESFMADG